MRQTAQQIFPYFESQDRVQGVRKLRHFMNLLRDAARQSISQLVGVALSHLHQSFNFSQLLAHRLGRLHASGGHAFLRPLRAGNTVKHIKPGGAGTFIDPNQPSIPMRKPQPGCIARPTGAGIWRGPIGRTTILIPINFTRLSSAMIGARPGRAL